MPDSGAETTGVGSTRRPLTTEPDKEAAMAEQPIPAGASARNSPKVYDRPGVYRMPADAYHACPCPAPSLSSGIVKTLLGQTPRHAWARHPKLNPAFEPENKQAFDFGTALHALMTREARDIVLVDGTDWRGKRAEARDAAYAEGRTPLLKAQHESLTRAADAIRAQLAEHQASDAFDHALGSCELTLLWREPNGVWCRCRPDWLPRNRADGMIAYDLKSTRSPANDWHRSIFWNLRNDVQAAWYRRGVRAVFGVQDVRYRFTVAELADPFATAVFECPPEIMDDAEREIESAIEIWGQCLRSGIWPAYTPEIVEITKPGWFDRRQADRAALAPAMEYAA